MNLFDLMAEAWRGLVRWPARTIIPALGVMVGTAALVSIVSTDQTWEAQVWDTYRRQGLGLIRVFPPRDVKLSHTAFTQADAAALRAALGDTAQVEYSALALTELYVPRGEIFSGKIVYGVSPGFFAVQSWAAERGRAFNQADFSPYARNCLVSPYLARQLFQSVDVVGKIVRVNGRDCKIVGLASIGRLDADAEGLLILPLPVFQEVFRQKSPDLSLTILAKDLSSLGWIHARTNDILSARLGASGTADFCRSPWVQIQNTLQARARVRSFLLAAIVLLLLTASFGISNVLIAAAHERAREIGAKRAFGATSLRIYLELTAEGLLIALAGALCGLALSFAVSYFISRFLMVDISEAYFGPSYTFVKEAVTIPPFSGLGVTARAIFFALFMVIAASLGASLVSVFFLGRLAPAQLFRLSAASRAALLLPLTVFQCLLGVSAVLVLVSIYQGLGAAGVEEARGIFGTNTIRIANIWDPRGPDYTAQAAKRYVEFCRDPAAVADLASACPEIAEIVTSVSVSRHDSPVRLPFRQIDLEHQHQDFVEGVSDNYFSTFFASETSLVSGRLPTQEELSGNSPVCVISEAAAEDLSPSGDILNQEINIGGKQFLVVGVVHVAGGSTVGGTFYPAKKIYLPLSAAPARWFTNQGLFVARIYREKNFAAADRQLKDALRSRLGLPPASAGAPDGIFTIVAAKTAFGIIDMMERASYRASIFGFIALLVAAMGVLNILLVSVQEDIREIGLRRALGATKAKVGFKYIARGLAITLTAGLLGALCGLFLAKLIGHLSGLPAQVPLRWMALSAGFLVLVGTAASLLPAIIASAVPPASALNYE